MTRKNKVWETLLCYVKMTLINHKGGHKYVISRKENFCHRSR